MLPEDMLCSCKIFLNHLLVMYQKRINTSKKLDFLMWIFLPFVIELLAKNEDSFLSTASSAVKCIRAYSHIHY